MKTRYWKVFFFVFWVTVLSLMSVVSAAAFPIADPKLVLLDKPTGHVDEKLKETIRTLMVTLPP